MPSRCKRSAAVRPSFFEQSGATLHVLNNFLRVLQHTVGAGYVGELP